MSTVMHRPLPFCLLLALPVIMMSGCQRAPEASLSEWLQAAEQQPVTPIPPLPKVQPFVPFPYNADGQLHDPFVPRKASVNSVNQPDLQRTREPLEAYPLESLKFVGVLSKKQKTFAMLQTPDNQIVQVHTGNYVGEHFGQITALAENPRSLRYEMTIRETIQDADSGEWTIQTKTLELQETP